MVRVVFIHPDLGIGGAERLIVDASMALQVKEHSTVIVTAHHDRSHCFTETISGECEVLCVGDWLPRSVMGRCQALCASIRMIYVTLYVMMVLQPADVVIVDQVSTPLPLLRAAGFPTLFYCHYPDLLLSTGKSLLKSIYRAPLDWLEEVTTGMANTVLVNSLFTKAVFRQTFSRLSHVSPQVLYPSLAMHMFDGKGRRPESVASDNITTFLSINRYERKKNIGLAIRAFSKLKDSNSRLVVAGGYDSRVLENVEHYQELVTLATDLKVEQRIIFLRSPDDQEKVWLLKNSSCLVYTPAGEHFGIVPLESMYCQTPVLAVRSGGPMETVAHQETGWLCEGDPDQFADVMRKVANNEVDLEAMGRAGKERVISKFSFHAFTQSLHDYVVDTAALNLSEPREEGGTTLFTKFALAFHFCLAMMVLFWMVFYTPLP